jgi:hypothetical protein
MTEVDSKLTGKQKLFADFYLGEAGLNQTRAAQLAGYAGDDNALAVAGSRLLRNAKVREYIDEQLSALTLSKNEVLTILTRQAKASLADLLDEEGDFVLADAKKRGVDSLLKKLKVKQVYNSALKETTTTYEYEMYDAQAAAVHLGKVHSLFNDNLRLSDPEGNPLTLLIRGAKGNDGPGESTSN